MLEARACLVEAALVVVMAAACTEPEPEPEPDLGLGCPSGEVCSPKTPYGIYLSSPRMFDTAIGASPRLWPVARGGTQLLSVDYMTRGGELRPMDLPYIVDVAEAIAVETVFSSSMAVRGVGVGAVTMRLVDERDGKVYGRQVVESVEIDRIELVVNRPAVAPPEAPFVFAVGAQWLGVRLFAAPRIGAPPERIVDESMRLELAGGVQGAWDALGVTVTAPAVHELSVHAGGEVRTFELPFVDEADAVEIMDAAPEYFGNVGATDVMCFYAASAGRVVAGVQWSFALDAGEVRNLADTGCVEYTPSATGTRRLTATSLGASREIAITVPF